MPQFTIRPATVDDATGISYVRHLGWQQTYRGILSNDYLDSMSLEQGIELWGRILQSKSGVTDVMLNAEGKIIGFVNGSKNRAPEVKCEGEICALYLLKQYHGTGLGRRLFLQGIKRLADAGYKSACLFVLKENPTVYFYKKFNPDIEQVVKVQIGKTQYDELGIGWSDINKISVLGKSL